MILPPLVFPGLMDGVGKEVLVKGKAPSGKAKGESIIVQLTSCLTGLDKSLLQIKTKIVSCHTADSKPVKQVVNSTVILPPLVYRVLVRAYRGQL